MSYITSTHELGVPSDLCMVTLEDAFSVMKDSLYGFYVLKVPSQTIPIAIVLQQEVDFTCYLEVDCEYDPDEWSLESITKTVQNGDDFEIHTYRIHSEGA